MDYLQQDRAITVTALNDYINDLMAADPILEHVHVRGEISNFKRHPSGHLYFSLKDEGGVLRCVMFRSSASKLNFVPKDGTKVVARGNVGVYSPTGQYQLYAQSLEQDGVGDLYRAFELLKAKLDAEGLFSKEKKPIPDYPKTIGIVTSPTGAAIQDMLNILARRYPLAEIILYPSLVQGTDAPKTLLAGIEYFNIHQPDVIIIGRGGGSIEDLWCFNDESLARGIAASKVPVISAVGHEVDYTICDFVADLRAPTPSAAAELAVPDMGTLTQTLQKQLGRARNVLLGKMNMCRLRLQGLTRSAVLVHPERVLSPYVMGLTQLEERLDTAKTTILRAKRQALALMAEKLGAMNPLAVLGRGYAVISHTNGEVISSTTQLQASQTIQIRMKDGVATANTLSISQENR